MPNEIMDLIKEQITLPEMFGVRPDIEEKRNDLLIASRAVATVTTAAEQVQAVSRARDIRTWIKEVESARVTLTKPLLETQRHIKALCDDHCAPLLQEQKRVERLVTTFQESEFRRVEAEEKQRREAFEKAERERIVAEEAARSAANNIVTDQQLADAIEKEEQAKAAAVKANGIVMAPLPEVSHATGATTRKVLRWEATDLNALVKARPDLCKIEAKASAIQATCVPEMPVDGLRLWWEKVTTIRTR